jgi:L-lactate dehydrogenase complex protein LldG
MSRDFILHRVRTAVGRGAGQAPAPAPEVYLRVPELSLERRIEMFSAALERLGGRSFVASSLDEARDYAGRLLEGKRAVASNAPLLAECGLTALAGVQSDFSTPFEWRRALETAEAGITGADFALADTGSLVLLSSATEARLVSLLPPIHLAVVSKDRLLAGLDEMVTLLPDPAALTSALVIITGPSRTADIEQILVRGVHGPREVHVLLV